MASRADLANAEVVDIFKRLARLHHSAALAQLTSMITASCEEGPGEVPTVVAFPQLDCESPRYTDLLPGAIGATCVWAFLYLFLLCFAVKTVASSRKGSAGTGRG